MVSCQIIDRELINKPKGGKNIISPTRFYVSINGDDSRTTSQANNPKTPWKSIQKAVDHLSSGDTLLIGEGVYIEKVVVRNSASGTEGSPTLITNIPGAKVVIDGQSEGFFFESLFKIESASHIEVRGLSAKNGSYYGFSADQSQHIKFKDLSTENTGGSGIYARLCSYIDISDNNIRKACQIQQRDSNGNGSQECITVAGTDNFKIYGNEIWDVPLNGVGGEGIDAKGASFEGEIYNNYIHDLARVGIYLDAGSREAYNIKVYSNKVYKCGGGLSVAGEIGGTIRNIYLYNNLLVDNTNSGVLFQSIGNGRFQDIYIVNNTLYNNGQRGFSGDISNFSQNSLNSNIQIVNNIFYNKTENYRFSIFHNIAAPHRIENNLYFDFKPGFAGGENNFTLANLSSADLREDPLFVDVANHDFRLKANSLAINKGTIVYFPDSNLPLLNKDFEGNLRNDEWDLGAFEN